jgi:ribonuclease VapC
LDLIANATGKTRLFLSIINLGEIAYIIEREHGAPQWQNTLERIRTLPIAIVGVDEPIVLSAAHIKAEHPVSYADAFAIALAQRLQATIVTGDPEFQEVEKLVNILWLREPTTKKRTTRERRAAYRTRSKRK